MESAGVPQDAAYTPRTLVLCFDGTDGSYGANNTNIVKFFSLLRRDCPEEQSVYYQPGVGTYEAPGIMGTIRQKIAMLTDSAFAMYLDAHVMGGYTYLMDNYVDGDRICLFGFSRGAYTARALAGMLYKVGLLPKDNTEQIGLAYNMYKGTSKSNAQLATGFRETFSRLVEIEFLGCWDTVSSVGVFWGRHLPFSASTTIIKRFRHAISLDEHRARFQPNTWHRDAPNKSSASGDPESGTLYPSSADKEGLSQPSAGPTQTDVLEVWFAGCHSDVGGGATPSDQVHCLGNIPLRWMLRQIVEAQCGIQFDSDALTQMGIPLSMIYPVATVMSRFARPEVKVKEGKNDTTRSSNVNMLSAPETSGPASDPLYGPEAAQADMEDATQAINDALVQQKIWWLLEIIPFHQSWQDENGRWHNAWRWNLGRPRAIATNPSNLHVTVQQRMNNPSLKYTPRAVWRTKPSANWVV
ncbi:hypothetical protein M422DRAFT_25315 [Sphaerobolus stellatus SS14]|uniref:T6SS Phospholipase effector Tle1-like catalytic domain-containing protein n=1 Tax=Sphaerobolus stellatus (strain SS14) TaxID=990650 RepID=A0A0C9UN07_SPHS4|nr:hypothetical protein M422DRAFT_38133 [Sphaerobolus stellatus SS14]KIJ53432.1 hypothetical protein M422DRAFT_25315 [Sphaerobolus stellatus SS14]